MECTLILPDSNDLTKDEVDSLWAQDVDLDDWDFILVIPPDQVEEHEETDTAYSDERGWHKVSVKELRPKAYSLMRFEVGCGDNKWYRVNFRCKQVAMLVAYHA